MKIFIITAAVYIILRAFAFADIIYFKNGGKLEGIIAQESNDYMVIDVGSGTISVRKNEVDYIEESSAENRERLKKKGLSHKIEAGEWAPAGYEEVGKAYLGARDGREALKKARKKSDALPKELCKKEARISKLLESAAAKGRELNAVDSKKDTGKYNKIVTEINSINAGLNREDNELKALREREKESNEDLAKAAKSYRDKFRAFRKIMNERYKTIDKNGMLPDEIYFFEELNNKALEMDSDFRKNTVKYISRDNQVVVDALINDSLPARLIVDTGASIVLISAGTAYRAGIRYGDISAEIDIIMADGSSAKAKPVTLKSLKVGNAEVKNVRAAILENNIAGGTDGLLGMSFLSHFIMSVDSAANQLTLERVLP
ncbi:MAG: TIGR02281 family clan AA aspartic protease [Candidatus Omnitrophota bacterium]|nr:TIGR02281 family clan AA aspartic protease [Candidatus Omnitrophota bacterium]